MKKIDNLEYWLPKNLDDISIAVCFDLFEAVGGRIFGEYLIKNDEFKDFLMDYYDLDESYALKYINFCESVEWLLKQLNDKKFISEYNNHNSNVRTKLFLDTQFGNENTISLIKKTITVNAKALAVLRKFDFCGENRFWSLFDEEIIYLVKKNKFFWCLPKPVYDVLYSMLYRDIGLIIPKVDFRRKHRSNDEISGSVRTQIEGYFNFIDYNYYSDEYNDEYKCNDDDNDDAINRDKKISAKFPTIRKIIFYQKLLDDLIIDLKRAVIENVGDLDLLQKGPYRIEMYSEEKIKLNEKQIENIFSTVEKANVNWKKIEGEMGVKNLKRDIKNKHEISMKRLKFISRILNVSYDYLLDGNIGIQEVKSEMGLVLEKPFSIDYGYSLKEVLLPNCVDSLSNEEKEVLREKIMENKDWLKIYVQSIKPE